jgi:hypothetical protein
MTTLAMRGILRGARMASIMVVRSEREKSVGGGKDRWCGFQGIRGRVQGSKRVDKGEPREKRRECVCVQSERKRKEKLRQCSKPSPLRASLFSLQPLNSGLWTATFSFQNEVGGKAQFQDARARSLKKNPRETREGEREGREKRERGRPRATDARKQKFLTSAADSM